MDVAETTAGDVGVASENTERVERCARWSGEDQAAEHADNDTEGWQQE